MGVSGTLFWVDGAEWSIVLGGWEWVGMSGGGWECLRCLIMLIIINKRNTIFFCKTQQILFAAHCSYIFFIFEA